jgi:hypothetical protein
MPDLTINNINQIIRDIRGQEIIFSHLPEDLIDHICCDVEYEMSANLSFDDAYNKVKSKIGPRRIKEIQEDTLYAVDTKYRNMKKTMKISGIISTVMLGFAAIFKIQHWPLAGILLTLGAVGLALVFMPSALNVLWKESKNGKKLFMFISAFLASLFFILGMLFKIQHWPGAGIMILVAILIGGVLFVPTLLVTKLRDSEKNDKRALYIVGAIALMLYMVAFLFKIMNWPFAGLIGLLGWLGLVFVAFPWYTVLTWKNETNVSAKFIYFTIAITLIVVPSALINLNLNRSYEVDFFDHLIAQESLFEYQVAESSSYLNSIENDSLVIVLEQLDLKKDQLISVIDDNVRGMVEVAEGEPGIPRESPRQITYTGDIMNIDYWMLNRPFMRGPFNAFVQTGTEGRASIDKALLDYYEYLSETVGDKSLENLSGLLDASIYIGQIDQDEEISLAAALHSLDLMKNGVMAVHSIVIREIATDFENKVSITN